MANNINKEKFGSRAMTRPSMVVTPSNTSSLRSKFEQLQVVSNNGSVVRVKRGVTESGANPTKMENLDRFKCAFLIIIISKKKLK